MGTLIEVEDAVWKKIKDAPGKSFNAKVKGIGETTSEMQLYSVPGILGRPTKETKGVSFRVGGLNIIIATHNYNLDKDLEEGDTLIYAMKDGSLASTIYLKANGETVFNDGEDYAVKFDELKKVVEELQDDITDLKSVFQNWVTSPQDGGAALKSGAATWFATPLSEDMDNTKVEKVRLP